MANRKTKNFLPQVFQTDTNEKFLSATMDQLISEPVLTNLNGYVGRRFAPTYKSTDSYITEDSNDRQNYQLEPSTVVKNDQNEVTFFSSYVDFLNKIRYYGGLTQNQDRLFNNEYYIYDPLISFDKLINFSQYYWLPDGPAPVQVNTTGVELEITYNVTRDTATGRYTYTADGVVDNSIILARGGTYRFVVNQPGYPFWIQSELGTDGLLNATPTISSRGVFGVENNGAEVGTVTFRVPQKDAQSRFVNMPTVASVDYATPLAYSDLQNSLLSRFRNRYPQYAGITGLLDGRDTIFVSQETLNNRGEEIWIAPNVIFSNTSITSGTVGDSTVTVENPANIEANLVVSGTGVPNGTTVVSVSGSNVTLSANLTANASGTYTFMSSDYDAGTEVPYDNRYGVWRVILLDIGLGDPLIRLAPIQSVSINQKIFIKSGLVNANKEFYRDFDGFFKQMPLLSSILDTLFVQDQVSSAINNSLKIVEYNNWQIDVVTDILGQQTYTSPNGVEFTSGLKIQFDTDVVQEEYRNNQYYVEHVGDLGGGIRLISVDELVTPELYNDENSINYPDTVFPEYITINRSSLDRNAWSRNNRWFHRDTLLATAEYNNTVASLDQSQRATRPIIQFESDILLYGSGRLGKDSIDVLDQTATDVFDQYNGQVITQAFGVTLVDGLRMVFAADEDPLVRNKIFVLNLVQYDVDSAGLPTGPIYTRLTEADDGTVETNDTLVVKQGVNKGKQFWYNGVDWLESQQKTHSQQEPLFDVYDSTYDSANSLVNNGRSISLLDRSTFVGTRIFGYKRSTVGVNDSVLGFPLSYKNFETQGDIEFENYFEVDQFESLVDGEPVTRNVSFGFLQKIRSRYTLSPKNVWITAVESSKQYQTIGYVYDGTSNIFPVDITPNEETSVPFIKVYKNSRYLTRSEYVLINGQIRLTSSEKFVGDGTTTDFRLTTVTSTVDGVIIYINGEARKAAGLYAVTGLVISFVTAPTQGDIIDIRVIQNPEIGDKIDIFIYSDEISQLGYYEVPKNLDLNAQNITVDTLTLGQLRNHLVAMGQNSLTLEGDPIGISNLRDVDIKQQGGTILQHSTPIPYGQLFLADQQANFVDAVRYAEKEYTRFKNKFLELSATLSGINPTDPVASVDLIMSQINLNKNPTFPFFYSDMVPYGTLKNEIEYTVFDPLDKDYEITTIFSDVTLSNQAVLVYLNDVQLYKDIDYRFRTDRPAITILTDIAVDDTIKFVEYPDTNGSYVPETPTKLNLWPKYKPELFQDNTYRETINVIRGHDGSFTPAFDDYRDGFLLELEKRIYNNIKIKDTAFYDDIIRDFPGKFRDTDYTRTEFTQLVSKNFQSWVGTNGLDFSENSTFLSNDMFTWNYGAFNDRVDEEILPGSWRACYQYFYDTFHPHLFPWEMLGFAIKPDWWETYYGPAPYTGGNRLLWQDLEVGRIRQGARAGIDPDYARPGLTTFIPVDVNGNLLPPASLLTASYNARRMAAAWSVGQYGPVEYAWRTSSVFPFAVQVAQALAVPARYFGINIDTFGYSAQNPVLTTDSSGAQVGQFLTQNDYRHIIQADIKFNGQSDNGSIARASGYLNYIADYLTSQGVNPSTKLSPLVENFNINLAYKLAGFTDHKYISILAEQVSPGSTNNSIVIPDENYKVHLNKSTPVEKIVYSGVIVEKTTNGYTVKGYDLNNPFFVIIPSVVNSNAQRITVLDSSATIYRDYQDIKLVIPYGYEFTSQQQIVDFLISYERYLLSQGITFTASDPDLGEIRNFKLSSQEFLYWAQQGWKVGSILVLSPIANEFLTVSVQAIADGISDSQYGSRVIDQNFKLIKKTDYEVMRSATQFKVTLRDSASVIGYVEIDLVQYEHVLIFDNTTVFNDIIYKPESGNRQYRLKLQGQKSAEWDGSLYAPGFIYNSGIVPEWQQGKDYLKGELVTYKNQYYTALQNVSADVNFQFNYWKQITSDEIKRGLLPNFSLLAAEGKAYYDSYPSVDNKEQIEYSHGLIGFRSRQYLSDLGITPTTQIEFYKGFIKQKGSKNAIDEMTTANFDNLSSNISLYEEWAIRIGTYGALDLNPYVEAPLDEETFGVNPGLIKFVAGSESGQGNGLDVFNRQQLYKLTDDYNGNIALNRTDSSDYNSDIKTAGYVYVDDVDSTIFDLADYAQLDADIDNIGTGYTIWCAKDFTGDWNVFRVTETNNFVLTVTNSLDGFVSFTMQLPHGLAERDIFLIKGFDSDFNGFYQVETVTDLNTVIVSYSGDTTNLIEIEGKGPFYVLDSMRFLYMEDSRIYGQPPNGWKVGEKIWIDVDAPTSLEQGQPVDTPNNTWKVYEKQHPWALGQALTKPTAESITNSGYGKSLRISSDGLIVVTGTPDYGNGVVNTWFKDFSGNFNQSYNVNPTISNLSKFGFAVDTAIATDETNKLAVGAPASQSNIGYVVIYDKSPSSDRYLPRQILVGNTADQFGSSLEYNQDGDWLYVGAPGTANVYIYGLDTSIYPVTQIESVSNENIITVADLTGSANAGFAQAGTTITEPLTGASIKVLEDVWLDSASGNIKVDSLTNIIPYAGTSGRLANISLTSNISANVGDVVSQDLGSGNYANILLLRQFANETKIYGIYQTAYVFSTVGNISINGVEQASVSPNLVNFANLFLNGTDTGLHANVVYSQAVTSNIALNFTPNVANDATSLLVTSGERIYIPNVEYYLDSAGGNIAFSSTLTAGEYTIKQQPYYRMLDKKTGNVGSNFGFALSSSYDGAQLAVGAPNDAVAVGANVFPGAGSVYVYDRVIEAFKTTGGTTFVTQNNINIVYKVLIDGVEVPRGQYTKGNATSITFNVAPEVGRTVYIEVNQFPLLERLIGVDSLEGGTDAIQANALFGTSLTICSNNCAIYIGAPNYDNGTEYNTGAVWKFHNKGRLYGTNFGYRDDPTFTPGDSIRLDNFEVVAQARMMPTTVNGVSANILTLSSNVRANVGDVISQDLGSAYYANVTVLANTAATGTQFITVTDYTTGNVFSYGFGTNVSVAGTPTTAYPKVSLDSLVKDINDANLLGITAENENGRLRLNSDSTVAKNLLRILAGTTTPGSVGILEEANLIVFAFMQIIINPYDADGEYFGTKVKLAANAYMLVIGSAKGTTRSFATFDEDTTVFDDTSTRLFDAIQSSGSVYIYELYDDPRDEVENPGRYAFAQQLNPGDLNVGDQFGYALDIESNYITVSAITDDAQGTDTGMVYVFENPTMTRGWKLIRYQTPKVDVDSVNRMFLYDSKTNIISTNLQFIDPAKGKILGQAEQEITYKTEFDPALYNRGSNANASINDKIYWSDNQIGQVWWNLSMVRFIDYEQDTLAYRSLHWGDLFPGSEIEVCEWVESSVLPSRYVESGGDGVPKYEDDSAYVEINFVDPVTNIIGSKYYFWVKDKTSVDPNNVNRRLPVTTVAQLIENPKNQGISYAAIVDNEAMIFFNIGQYLSAQDTILHVDYQSEINRGIIHSEYELAQKDNPDSVIPEKIVNKMIDSLAGLDRLGSVVPDPTLSVADRYGIEVRPRQSMFVDRLEAMRELLSFVNPILLSKPIARQYDLSTLQSEEPMPNIKLGEYDESVPTDVDLQYLDTAKLSTGYTVLVEQDTTQNNLWALYELQSDKQWLLSRIQSYKTSLYWNYVDWYAEDYDANEVIEFAVDTLPDALKLPVATGDEILVRVAAGPAGGWNLLTVLSNGEFQVVGIENGTIQLSDVLGYLSENALGYSNQGYDSNRYDQNPNIEIRYIIQALKNDIFINELEGKFNELFFALINYLFNEQKYVDWTFKSSFVSVTHFIRSLEQFPSYVRDNQTYYQNYIEEVKPYRTKIREYLLNYTGSDTYQSTLTDFDLPPYYDTSTGYGTFRSPNGESPYQAVDAIKWQTYPYTYWYDNRRFQIGEILITNPGSGYSTAPIVQIIAGAGGGSGATAVATIDGDTGAVTSITLTNPGSGYITTPTVIVNGSATEDAKAYAVLYNPQLRTFDTELKFDRVNYSSVVVDWTANTAYTRTTFDANGRYTGGSVVSYLDADGVRTAYSVNANITSGNTFVESNYTVFKANAFTNANDRILGYYQPSSGMPARDLNQLIFGIEYPGVQVQGPQFGANSFIGFGGIFSTSPYDNVAYDSDGRPLISEESLDTIIRSSFTDSSLGTRPEDINVDGGAYVDEYSSHAPEELVPGITFDTLNMKVFTQDGGDIWGYRIFKDMLRDTYWLRIADNYTTTLANALSVTDDVIYVSNSSALWTPNITYDRNPGVVFIGSERITYWTNTEYSPVAWSANTAYSVGSAVSYLGNNYVVTGNVNAATFNFSNVSVLPSLYALGRIRRGTAGTPVGNSYPVGTLVTDASVQQQIPDLYTIDVRFAQIQFSEAITANVGDYITQPQTSTVLRVVNTAVSTANVSVTYQGQFSLTFGNTTNTRVTLGGNISSVYPVTTVGSAELTRTVTDDPSYFLGFSNVITANVGDTITQSTSGANATVLARETANLLIVSYNSALRFDYYPTSGNVIATTNVAVNGSYTGNIYPTASNIAGFIGSTDAGNVTVDASSTVTIEANARLQQSNVWYNAGATTATDGTGLAGALTAPALFIKAELAILNATSIKPDELTTEDAINTLTTEDGTEITEE